MELTGTGVEFGKYRLIGTNVARYPSKTKYATLYTFVQIGL